MQEEDMTRQVTINEEEIITTIMVATEQDSK